MIMYVTHVNKWWILVSVAVGSMKLFTLPFYEEMMTVVSERKLQSEMICLEGQVYSQVW